MDIAKIIKESIDEYNRTKDDHVFTCVGCIFAKRLGLDCNSMRDCDECYMKSLSKLIEDDSICDDDGLCNNNDDDDICGVSKNNEAEFMRVVAKKYYFEAIDDFNTRCRNNIKMAAYIGHLSCTVPYSNDTNPHIIDVVKEKLENDGYVVTTPYDDDHAVISDVPGDPISLKISWD